MTILEKFVSNKIMKGVKEEHRRCLRLTRTVSQRLANVESEGFDNVTLFKSLFPLEWITNLTTQEVKMLKHFNYEDGLLPSGTTATFYINGMGFPVRLREQHGLNAHTMRETFDLIETIVFKNVKGKAARTQNVLHVFNRVFENYTLNKYELDKIIKEMKLRGMTNTSVK